MSTELKPCPFCGSSNVAQGASSDRISVWCFCGARGPEVAFPQDCIDPVTPIKECHAAWNRRSSPSQVAPAYPAQMTDAVVEALVLMVDAFLSRNGGSFPMDEVTKEQRLWKKAMKAAYAVIGQPRTRERDEKLAALTAAIGAGGQAVADLTYGQKLIAEAIEHHFGERAEDYDEDSDDTTNRDVWEAFDALSQPHPADERVVEALRKIEYCLTKDSLCEAEKIDDALKAVRRLIAATEGR